MPRLYLCDDQPEYRLLLKTVLTEDGLDVVGEGGDAGVCTADAAEVAPDVILLDVNMPGTNGIAALPGLREALPDACVVMLSNASPEEYERSALDAGASGFIQKPRNIFDLPVMVRQKLAAAGIEL